MTKNPWPEGPYTAMLNDLTNTHQVRGPDGELLAIVGTMRLIRDPQARSLAILFAHAPELFDCLEKLTRFHELETQWNGQLVFQCPDCGEREGKHALNCDFRAAMLAISRVRAITAEILDESAREQTDATAHLMEVPR